MVWPYRDVKGVYRMRDWLIELSTEEDHSAYLKDQWWVNDDARSDRDFALSRCYVHCGSAERQRGRGSTEHLDSITDPDFGYPNPLYGWDWAAESRTGSRRRTSPRSS